MIDQERFVLAQATVQMGSSPAFVDMLDGLNADTEELERAVLESTSVDEDRVARVKFMEWQAHRKVVLRLRETIKNAAQDVKAMQEDLELERDIERQRGTRSGW